MAKRKNNHGFPAFLKLLAHDVRWRLLEILAGGDHRVMELTAQLGLPQNAISYHLRLLREGELIHEQRSAADGRDIYYSLNLDRLQREFQESGEALHPALLATTPLVSTDVKIKPNTTDPFRVLFLCTHNSARSQLAEGILRARGGELVSVFSAGSERGRVHPLAIRAARKLKIDISDQRSKHMEEFAGQRFDYVITVCDRVRENCPVFPGDPHQIHWSIPDPAAVTGTVQERVQAFLKAARELQTRIGYLHLMMGRRVQAGADE